MTALQSAGRLLTGGGRRRDWLTGYLFASPFILGFLIFIAYPMLHSAWLIMFEWDPLREPEFSGFANIVKMLQDPKVNKSLFNSFFYTVIAVPVQLCISFTLALALSQPLWFRDYYRAAFYLPIIVPLVASAVVWQRVFHPEFGILNEALGWFGVVRFAGCSSRSWPTAGVLFKCRSGPSDGRW